VLSGGRFRDDCVHISALRLRQEALPAFSMLAHRRCYDAGNIQAAAGCGNAAGRRAINREGAA
jgi:hypothetical protein